LARNGPESLIREQIKVKRDGLAEKIARVQGREEFTPDILYKYEAVVALCDRALAVPEGRLVEVLTTLAVECREKLDDPRQEFNEVKEERKRVALTLFADYCRRWIARVEPSRG
jgi:hypothetical protein